MSNRGNPKIFIRRPPNQSLDHNESLVSNANITGRTVSSSSNASMMSTPSNNIRRIQEQRQQQSQLMKTSQANQSKNARKNSKARFSGSRPSNSNVKYKLLNLQKSSKRFSSSELAGHSSEKLITSNINQTIESISLNNAMKEGNGYDYSVYVKRDTEDSGNHLGSTRDRIGPSLEQIDNDGGSRLNASVKQSQISAWESAEKVTKNLIFNNSSDDDDDELEDSSSLLGSKDAIKSIPGYTDGELNFIISRYNSHLLRINTNGELTMADFHRLEEEEEKILWEYRQRHQVSQERIFAQYSSMNDKRKVQVSQKKELLKRIFGNSNNLNQNFITNNTSYSIMENVSNSQLTFHEDEEEISQILEAHEYFQKVLEETLNLIKNAKNHILSASGGSHGKHKLNGTDRKMFNTSYTGSDIEHFSSEKFQSIVASQLDGIYGKYIKKVDKENGGEGDSEKGENRANDNDNENENEEDDNDEERDELQSFSIAYLRKCVREDIDEENGGETGE
ncbi:hypothetical protein CLIB1423_08S04104 [[Candida] railenensis]|uniref:Uncharacterized protein n=1 Tax=[Candida] railenensis TaxID=45579 RepID=A0A9P0QQW4_9ASCO|nr:hypothetical protein CLIB1423_08S04104 [[Candida] railenensis]